MRNAEGGGTLALSGDQNDDHHSIVSDLVSLIEHVQSSMRLLESAIATESSPGRQEAAGNVIVLDDLTPRYQSARAALCACNAGLGLAHLLLLDTSASSYGTDESTERDLRPARLIGRA
jgi:hypothetical protein